MVTAHLPGSVLNFYIVVCLLLSIIDQRLRCVVGDLIYDFMNKEYDLQTINKHGLRDRRGGKKEKRLQSINYI